MVGLHQGTFDHHLLPPARFGKTEGGIVLIPVAVSAVPVDVSPYISVAIKGNVWVPMSSHSNA